MKRAFACVRGVGIRGIVRFACCNGGVLVTAEIFGLSDGFHGFHIHEGGDCGGENFANTGVHYGEGPHPDHAGDLPPLLSCNGRAFLSTRTERLRICDLLGRTVVIHSLPDDFYTQPAGKSGQKIACGRIIFC